MVAEVKCEFKSSHCKYTDQFALRTFNPNTPKSSKFNTILHTHEEVSVKDWVKEKEIKWKKLQMFVLFPKISLIEIRHRKQFLELRGIYLNTFTKRK